MSSRPVTLVGSANALVGMAEGWRLLRAGGTALDAVEAVARAVEDDPTDHTVGFAGYPNLLGEVELDASIMDGTSRAAGAVGALAGFRHPITVARAVMERTPHALIVGTGAAALARELGMEAERLLTPEIEAVWRSGVRGEIQPDGFGGAMLSRVAHLVKDPDRVAGTVNVIAVDGQGRIAAAASTSGWAWKYPGRLGDTPIPGAGIYADDRYGAAACTGWGELAIRAGASRSVVALLARGRGLEQALFETLADMASLEESVRDIHIHLIGLDADGRPAAASTKPGAEYVVQQGEMPEPELRPRRLLA
jgi:beta-aspartyl-peptidase (threonine type)